jgi:hypothetical protein
MKLLKFSFNSIIVWLSFSIGSTLVASLIWVSEKADPISSARALNFAVSPLARAAFALVQRDTSVEPAVVRVVRAELPAYLPPTAAAVEKTAIVVAQ